MNEYEKGYRDAQVKIIRNMYDIEGEWLLRECDRLEKEIGIPAKEIGRIIWDYKNQISEKVFEQIVAESDSKEEAIYHLTVVSHFNWDFITKNLGVTDEFIKQCLSDKNLRHKTARIIYEKLKNRVQKLSYNEKCFYRDFLEGYIDGLTIGDNQLINAVNMMYNFGDTTETIKHILQAYNLTDEEFEYLIEKAKQMKND